MALRVLRATPTSLAPLPSQPAGAARPRCRLGLLAAAAFFVAACSGDNDIAEQVSTTSSAPTTETVDSISTTSTSSTTSTRPPNGDQVEDRELVDRYLGFWDARFAANEEPPDPDDSALAEFATGPQLENVITETRQRLYRPDTGEVIDDSVVTRSVSADMVLVDGVWKLERATVVQQWEGIAGCALAD